MTNTLQALCIAELIACLIVQVVGRHGAPWLTGGVMFALFFVGLLLFIVCAAFHPEATVTSDLTSTTVSLPIWNAIRVCPLWLLASLITFCVFEISYLAWLWASLGLGPGDELTGLVPPRPSFWGAFIAMFPAFGFCLLDARRRLNPFAD